MARSKYTHFAFFAAIAVVVLSACDGNKELSIDNIDPRVGHTQGDQPVRITGKNFRADIGYTVYFGNKKAATVTLLNPKTLLVSSPSREDAGDVDITIRADDGQAFRIDKGFRYENMGGSVVENLGEPGSRPKAKDSKLAY